MKLNKYLLFALLGAVLLWGFKSDAAKDQFQKMKTLTQIIRLVNDNYVEEIKMDEYLKELEDQAEKKNDLIKDKSHFKRKSKLAKYLINRGFENNLVWEKINEIYNK